MACIRLDREAAGVHLQIYWCCGLCKVDDGSSSRRGGSIVISGVVAMQHYRAYFLDRDGHISNAIDMECTDDEQARECAKKFLSDRNAELWQEDRLIAIYAAGKGPLPPPDNQQC